MIITETARICEHLLLALHDLIREGRGDDSNADALRDEIEQSLRRLSPAERTLAATVASSAVAASERVRAEDFSGAMAVLASLRAPVDTFFEQVTVNDADPELRRNRLRLLSALRRAVHEVADISRIGG